MSPQQQGVLAQRREIISSILEGRPYDATRVIRPPSVASMTPRSGSPQCGMVAAADVGDRTGRSTHRSSAFGNETKRSWANGTVEVDGMVFPRIATERRASMIEQLKGQWDEVNREYQKLTLSLFTLDSVQKVAR